MRHPLEIRFERSFPPEQWLGRRMILAVSGGPDSMALLRLTAAVASAGERGRIVVVHVNHHLRAEDSDEDARFTNEAARRHGFPCRILDCPLPSMEGTHGSLEDAARRKRYAVLLEQAESWGARYVLTGHTADDQAETVLFRLVRGSGLRGLAGIPRVRPFGPAALTRPLLSFFRKEILDYLDSLGQEYRLDRSNGDPKFRRNVLRHRVLPLLEAQVSGAATSHLNRLADLARECDDFVRSQAAAVWPRVVAEASPKSLRLRVTELRKLHPFLIKEVLRAAWQQQGWPLREMGYRRWTALLGMVYEAGPPTARKSPTRSFPGSILARREGEYLVLECAMTPADRPEVRADALPTDCRSS
ncbi:MAG: tRNA lysidine(34) synthetase TilS [Thermogutta sp.]|nr:tRNA lysidine(34) synthetase TilS [Thermogutta sp.]